MNERIKQLRKALGLSGERFGEKIGLTRMSVSNLEAGRYNLTEQTIKSICREFKVNEDWLRNGDGDMFASADNVSIEELINSSKADDFEVSVIKAYFSLDKGIRKKAIEHFKSSLFD